MFLMESPHVIFKRLKRFYPGCRSSKNNLTKKYGIIHNDTQWLIVETQKTPKAQAKGSTSGDYYANTAHSGQGTKMQPYIQKNVWIM